MNGVGPSEWATSSGGGLGRTVMELQYHGLEYAGADRDLCRRELLAIFRRLGAPEATVSEIEVRLRPGGTTAEIGGPCGTVRWLRGLLLRSQSEDLRLQGVTARIAGVTVEELSADSVDAPSSQEFHAQRLARLHADLMQQLRGELHAEQRDRGGTSLRGGALAGCSASAALERVVLGGPTGGAASVPRPRQGIDAFAFGEVAAPYTAPYGSLAAAAGEAAEFLRHRLRADPKRSIKDGFQSPERSQSEPGKREMRARSVPASISPGATLDLFATKVRTRSSAEAANANGAMPKAQHQRRAEATTRRPTVRSYALGAAAGASCMPALAAVPSESIAEQAMLRSGIRTPLVQAAPLVCARAVQTTPTLHLEAPTTPTPRLLLPSALTLVPPPGHVQLPNSARGAPAQVRPLAEAKASPSMPRARSLTPQGGRLLIGPFPRVRWDFYETRSTR